MNYKKVIKVITEFFMPRKCIFCGEILTEKSCADCDIKLKELLIEKQERTRQATYTNFKYLDFCTSFYEYKGVVRDTILKAKFKSCAGFISEFLQYIPIDLQQFIEDNEIDIIISAPSHKSKLYNKEFDFTQEMAKKIAKRVNLEYNFTLIIKNKITLKQHNLSQEKRKTNLKNAFSIKGEVAGKNILIVDDILTTGHTLEEIAHTLKTAKAKRVVGMTFAYNKYEEGRKYYGGK